MMQRCAPRDNCHRGVNVREESLIFYFMLLTTEQLINYLSSFYLKVELLTFPCPAFQTIDSVMLTEVFLFSERL